MLLFTRDLRLDDNMTIASTRGEPVIPLFIFNPKQLDSAANKYFSKNAAEFMLAAISSLDSQIRKKYPGRKLHLAHGDPATIIGKMAPAALYICEDYTPFAKSRLTSIKNKYSGPITVVPDLLLTGAKDDYKKFTAFYNKYKSAIIRPETSKFNPVTAAIPNETTIAEIQKIYNLAAKPFTAPPFPAKYADARDDLALRTSELSAFLKFGAISVRELAADHRRNAAFIRQLLWRDFYYNLAENDENLLLGEYWPKFDMKWSNKHFGKWCAGETGFPIVDAAMNQLNETGYMHNRARMIVASFLVKNLHVDWRQGEKYFATKLRDYDPIINFYNWQSIFGSGPFGQPYFRVFNPALQQKKHDPEGKYVAKYRGDKNLRPIVDYDETKEYFLKHVKK